MIQLHRDGHLPEPTIVTSYESFTASPVALRAVGADADGRHGRRAAAAGGRKDDPAALLLGWTAPGRTKPCVAGADDSERHSAIAAVLIVFVLTKKVSTTPADADDSERHSTAAAVFSSSKWPNRSPPTCVDAERTWLPSTRSA